MPPIPDTQYVQAFFCYALARQAGCTSSTNTLTASEGTYWYNIIRTAHPHGQDSLIMAFRELGKTLFESTEYLARNTNNHDYVQDLYQTYLLREPDTGGWAFWENLVPAVGRENVRRAFDESTEFFNDISLVTLTGSVSGPVSSLISARVNPVNQSGNQILARDAEWGAMLVSLPGRAGLDLGLGISYSSAATWTTSGPYVYFDEDNSSLSPGFRFGFPTVQEKFFDAAAAQNVYLLITSAGQRVALRQIGSTNVYAAGDSSYLELTDNGGNSLLLRTTDGSQFTYTKVENEYRCTNIKDANGNYITANYNGLGDLTTVVDTLNRTITFAYDLSANLNAISQTWNGQTHYWAFFGFTPITIQPNFSGLTLSGVKSGQSIPALQYVYLADYSYFKFTYDTGMSTKGLVAMMERWAFDGLHKGWTIFDYVTSVGDIPRLTATHEQADSWGDLSGLPYEAVTQFGVASDGARRMVAPDGTVYREYFGTGWQRGLVTTAKVFANATDEANNIAQKTTTITWTQDDTNLAYEKNPRITETNVSDGAGNNRRVTFGYTTFTRPSGALCALRSDTNEFNGLSLFRRTHQGWPQLDSGYLSRGFIGLLNEVDVYDASSGAEVLVSKTTFTYDLGGEFRVATNPSNDTVTQHDPAYDANFAYRGNVSKAFRYDVVNDPNNLNNTAAQSHSGYNSSGSLVFERRLHKASPAVWHQTSVAYTDSFSNPGSNGNTFAYPTTVTDPDGFQSFIKYNFDFGGVTEKQTPSPNAGQTAPKQLIAYDSLGRVSQLTNNINGAYVRNVYGATYVQTYSTVNTAADEAYSISFFDGAGRAYYSAGNHPGSTGGYKAVSTKYDVMGRVWKVSNPAEVNASSAPTGDDAGWFYTTQTYDWKGRPLRTTNQDGTYKELSYSGCGCAGGEVVTLTDEGTIDGGVAKRRQQKIHSDALGRTVKTEQFNWQGGSIYSTTVNTYNVLDQVTQIREFKGAGPADLNDPSCLSGACQKTTMTYDGHGRLKTRHVPEQNVGTNTTWDYNADDTVQKVTDARGATCAYGYNGRHQVASKVHALSGQSTISVSYGYDAAGNRLWMDDGPGRVDYEYDALSRLRKERRQFSVGTFNIDYEYNFVGDLKKVTDPFGASFDYQRNSQSELTAVTGSPFAGWSTYISNVAYRAWGAPKSVSYVGSGSTISYNGGMLPEQFRLTVNGTGASIIREDYGYFADGRLSQLTDLDDTPGNNPPVTLRFLSRQYTYDHVGRVKGGSGATGGGVPYSQGYSYDEFGNMTGRVGSYYNYNNSQPATDTGSYTDNRRGGWSYNADGQVTATPASSTDNPRTVSYDAAGRMSTTVDTGQFSTVTYSAVYDGDGQLVYETSNTAPGSFVASYIVRSTVLGDVLTRLDQSGNKKITHVPAEGLLFATQRTSGAPGPYVDARLRNPLGITETTKAVYDPLGNYIPFQAHGDPRPPAGSYTSASMGGVAASAVNPHSYAMGCIVDGLPMNCTRAMHLVNKGDAAICDDNDCSPRSDPNRDGPGRRGWVIPRFFPQGLFYAPLGPSSGPKPTKPVLKPRGPGDGNPDDEDEEEPQNTEVTTVDPRGIRNALDRMLRISGCGSFVEELINRLAADTKNPFVSDYALDLFDAVEGGKGGFVRGGLANKNRVGATISGSINSRNAAIHLTSHFEFGSSDPQVQANAVNFIDAFQSLHELVHLAGSKRYYTDTQIAKTLSNWLGIPGLPVRKKGESERDFIGRNSAYFSSVLSTKCPVLSR